MFVRLFRKIKDILTENRYFRLYLNDPEIRLNLSLISGLFLNLIYVVFNAVSGILYRSPWLITVAVYHVMLVSVHYIILRVGVRDSDIMEEHRACIRGGAVLLFMDVAMTAIILGTLRSGRVPTYSGLVIVALAAFAIYTLAVGTVSLVRIRRDSLPIHRAAYTVRIAAALMSAFNLFTAILSRLSLRARAAIALQLLCGTFVSVCVLGLAIFMIAGSRSALKRN